MAHPVSASTLRNRLLNRARLRHLHLFVKVAELQTVKRAAEAVGISQPSATQALSDLEQLLGCSLFLRHAQGMAPTTAGRLLLPLARRMLGLVDDTATRAAEIAQGAQGVVRVASISAAIGGPLGDLLPAFARQHPQVLVELVEADAQQQSALLAQREVDCAVCRRPPVLPAGWAFAPLWRDQFGIVAGPGHPITRKRRVGMDDLLACPWLVSPTSIAAREAFDRFFAGHAAAVRHYSVISSSPTALWTLLSQEPVLTLVPLSLMQRYLRAGLLRQIAWPDPMPFDAIGVMAPEAERGRGLEDWLAFLHHHADVPAP